MALAQHQYRLRKKYLHAVLSAEDRSLLSGMRQYANAISAHRSPGGLISDRPSSDITRHHAGKVQA